MFYYNLYFHCSTFYNKKGVYTVWQHCVSPRRTKPVSCSENIWNFHVIAAADGCNLSNDNMRAWMARSSVVKSPIIPNSCTSCCGVGNINNSNELREKVWEANRWHQKAEYFPSLLEDVRYYPLEGRGRKCVVVFQLIKRNLFDPTWLACIFIQRSPIIVEVVGVVFD